MPDQHPITLPSSAKSTSSDHGDRDTSNGADDKHPIKETATVTGLATTETQRMEAALGDYILRFLRIRKGPKNDIYDLDAVRICLQDSSGFM
jgi:hypothetical protein